MKLLLISVKSDKLNGGIAVWTENYIKSCKEFGIVCDIVNTNTINGNTSSSKKRNFKEEFIRTKRIYKDLGKDLKENKYDVAHLNTNIGIFGVIRDYYAAKKIKKYNIPIALHFHCDIPYWCNNFLIKHYLKKILKISNVNFVLCKNSGMYLKDVFNSESVIVPNFVNAESIKNCKNISKEIKSIFFCGRISKEKGATEIFKLAHKFPGIIFRLAGSIAKDVELWDKPENVVLLNSISHEEVILELDNADIFLFPTYTEGFSLSLAEAMSRGVPVIATDVGANADMIEDNGGIIVSVNDIEAMEKAIEKMQNADLRKSMSEWNINKVRSNYTIEKIMQKFLDEYSKITIEEN